MATRSRGIIRIAIVACGLLPTLALAADPILLCPGQSAEPGPDGRVLGHIAYDEVAPIDLVPAPAGFAIGLPCRDERDGLPDLARMLDAARATPGVEQHLRAVSCFRSVSHQSAVFCGQIGPRRRCKNAADRALLVGPPGYSEHATGYAIDFGVRPSPGCGDVEPCVAATLTGQWLVAHAAEYGFELSFPAGNAQGVSWEPWHWRWVGTSADTPGALRARLTFAHARIAYPASPAVRDHNGDQPVMPPGAARPGDIPPPRPTPGAPYIHLPPNQ